MQDHQPEVLHAPEVENIHVVDGHHTNQLDQPDLTRHINEHYAVTNMVNTLFAADSVMTGKSDLIISCGDIVYEPSVFAALQELDAPISLTVDRK